LHSQGYFKQAKPEYLASLEADAHLEQAWCNLGCIYAAERNYEKAIEAFERAIAIKPNRTTTLNGYASALYGAGRIDGAIKQWHKTIDLDPTFEFASYNLANALELSGRHDEAQETLRKAGLLGTKGQIIEPKIPANQS
jgi:tetratricopeptide (TPR) repeat protein